MSDFLYDKFGVINGRLRPVDYHFLYFPSMLTFYFCRCAPIIEKIRGIHKIRQALSLVTAAVVEVVLNLTLYLGKAVIFPDEVTLFQLDLITLGWIILSFQVGYDPMDWR